ncbi:MAG: SpaH/EbpB family LPXTG-anchored major pilin [Finegoldia magna]|nr:SpaH/EbpB family LPXTG-anchored major pilin [Finegoldia magna]
MKKRFLSLIIALAMMVGVFTPLLSSAAETPAKNTIGTIDETKLSENVPTSTTVNVYKLQAKEYNDPKQWNHNGGKLTKEQLATLGKDVKGLKGVEFSYYSVTAAQLEKLKATKPAPATAEEVKKALGEEFTQEPTKLALTDKNGMATVSLANGNYWFIETAAPANVTTNGSHAIPFGLTLPQVQLTQNEQGELVAATPTKYLTELNIYPKNTTTTPKVDKDFEGKADANRDINTEKNEKRDYTLGDDVPYEIQTIIPAHTKYGSVYWTDQMTEGLTFKKDTLKVKFDETEAVAEDYTLEEVGNGFKLSLTEAGLKKVENKDADVKITVTYKATLNKKSVVNIPESNDVIFHYGNKPGKGNTPIPNKPNNGKMEFTKTWDGEAPEGASITVQLYNANTGEKVGESKTLNAENKFKVEWTGLDDKIEYKVEEKSVEGYEAEYSKGDGLGVLGVKNWKSENPEPLNPHEPKVIHYGKRFVKADKGTNKSLEGAQFVVKFKKFTSEHLTAQKDKYLARKTAEQTNADRAAYLEARAIYEDMFKEGSGKTQEQANAYYNENVKPKFEALNTEYVWKEATVTAATGDADFDNKDNLVVLESDKAGRFAIDGLPAGTYELVEVKAPKGYALPTNNFEFSVNEKSFNEQGDVKYEEENKEVTVATGKTAMRINNSNMTIPQTGGIGTIIFTAIGLAIMASAIIAIKKRQATEAR